MSSDNSAAEAGHEVTAVPVASHRIMAFMMQQRWDRRAPKLPASGHDLLFPGRIGVVRNMLECPGGEVEASTAEGLGTGGIEVGVERVQKGGVIGELPPVAITGGLMIEEGLNDQAAQGRMQQAVKGIPAILTA